MPIMHRRLKLTAAALAVTAVAVLNPAPALAARGFLIKQGDQCLTYGIDHTPRKVGYRAWGFSCQVEEGYLWKRTKRGQLAVTYRGRTLCLSAPSGTLVLMRRCGSDLKRQQFTFPVVKRLWFDKIVLIKWKNLPNTCLYLDAYGPYSFGQISAMTCEPGNSGQQWLIPG